jgi:hypothetical protein
MPSPLYATGTFTVPQIGPKRGTCAVPSGFGGSVEHEQEAPGLLIGVTYPVKVFKIFVTVNGMVPNRSGFAFKLDL